MRLEPTEGGFQIDAADLAGLLGLGEEDVQRLMREGQINSLSEEGQGEDEGRHRITFRHGSTRVRLTVNTQGEVLLQSRTRTAPHPGTSKDPISGQAKW
tara:strand:- start:345 stop:641 length:297 start_codon:yes stop_codon:yes gene_type:complete